MFAETSLLVSSTMGLVQGAGRVAMNSLRSGPTSHGTTMTTDLTMIPTISIMTSHLITVVMMTTTTDNVSTPV